MSLNIGSLIGILGLATFICDIVALYVHRSSDVYRQQKFQDVDLNLLRLETLNSLAEGMVSEVAKHKHQQRAEEAILAEVGMSNAEQNGEHFNRNKSLFYGDHQRFYDETGSMSSPMMTPNNHANTKPTDGMNGLSKNHITSSTSSIKQRRSPIARPKLLHQSSSENDRVNIMYVDEESPNLSDISKSKSPMANGNNDRSTQKIETLL